jgi:hypothetical protein
MCEMTPKYRVQRELLQSTNGMPMEDLLVAVAMAWNLAKSPAHGVLKTTSAVLRLLPDCRRGLARKAAEHRFDEVVRICVLTPTAVVTVFMLSRL